MQSVRRTACSSHTDLDYEIYIIYISIFIIDTKGQEPSLANKKILLLESSSDVPSAVAPDRPFSNRVCAISVGSARFLKRACVGC